MEALLSILLIWMSQGLAQIDAVAVIHVNDSHSNLAPVGPRTPSLVGTRGAIARAASIVGSIRTARPDALLRPAGERRERFLTEAVIPTQQMNTIVWRRE